MNMQDAKRGMDRGQMAYQEPPMPVVSNEGTVPSILGDIEKSVAQLDDAIEMIAMRTKSVRLEGQEVRGDKAIDPRPAMPMSDLSSSLRNLSFTIINRANQLRQLAREIEL